MTKKQRIITTSVIASIILISLGANGYFLINNWLKAERATYANLGAIQLRENVYNTATQNGFVVIGNAEGKQIKLTIE